MEYVSNMQFELKRRIKTFGEFIPACCVTKNGEFLETNQTKEKGVRVINADESKYSIPFPNPYSAYDIVCIDDSTIAVSSGPRRCDDQKCGISIVDLNEHKISSFIDLTNPTYGITYDGKSLICCVEYKDLHVVSYTDHDFTKIPNTTSESNSFVSTFGNKIFHTRGNTLSCISYNGTEMWKYIENSETEYRASGTFGAITVDNDGNIFAILRDKYAVIVISPDGRRWKMIISPNDYKIDRPTAIFFDKEKKELILAHDKTFADVGKIWYQQWGHL